MTTADQVLRLALRCGSPLVYFAVMEPDLLFLLCTLTSVQLLWVIDIAAYAALPKILRLIRGV